MGSQSRTRRAAELEHSVLEARNSRARRGQGPSGSSEGNPSHPLLGPRQPRRVAVPSSHGRLPASPLLGPWQPRRVAVPIFTWSSPRVSSVSVPPFLFQGESGCRAHPDLRWPRLSFLTLFTSFPSPGHLPNPGIKPRSPALQADSLPFEPPRKPNSQFWGSRWTQLWGEHHHLPHCREPLVLFSEGISLCFYFNSFKFSSHKGS